MLSVAYALQLDALKSWGIGVSIMKNIIALSVIAVLFSAGVAHADPTLAVIKNAMQRAIARKAEIEKKAKEDKVALEKAAAEAIENARTVAGKVESTVKGDLADVKQKMIEEIVCQVKNAKTSDQISGIVHGTGAGNLTLKLGSIVSEDTAGEKLAIKFIAEKSAKDDDSVTFQLLDLNKQDQKPARTVSLKDLGLQTECKKQRRVETITEGIRSVNDQTVSKILPDVIQIIPQPIDPNVVEAAIAAAAK